MRPDFQSWYAEHLGWPFPGLKEVYFDAKVQAAKPYFGEGEHLLSSGKLLEECVYLQQHHMDWQSIGSQEITGFLGGRFSSLETVHRMEQRFAPLLPQPQWLGLTGRAMELIQASLEKPLPVGQLARALQVSPEHLSRVFKAQTGKGLHHSIHAAKMERAKAMLRQSALSVGEISSRLGYQTPQHFSRIFRQVFGGSPREFR